MISQPVSTGQLLNQLTWRYATKQFDPSRKIPDETWNVLEQAMILSPSSFGLQPWKFYVVTNQQIKLKLREVSWNQPQVSDCSHHVVFAVRTGITRAFVDEFVESIAQTRKVPRESLEGYRQMMLSFLSKPNLDLQGWATKQAYIALGQLVAAAAMIGVDACPMEGITPGAYDEILGITADGHATSVACALGYRAATDKYADAAKVRFPASKVVKHIA